MRWKVVMRTKSHKVTWMANSRKIVCLIVQEAKIKHLQPKKLYLLVTFKSVLVIFETLLNPWNTCKKSAFVRVNLKVVKIGFSLLVKFNECIVSAS